MARHSEKTISTVVLLGVGAHGAFITPLNMRMVLGQVFLGRPRRSGCTFQMKMPEFQ